MQATDRLTVGAGRSVEAVPHYVNTALGFSRITSHETRVTAFMLFTSHESRLFLRECARAAQPKHRPDRCPRRQVTVFQFAIVHHCSLLFSKKYCSAPVSSRRPNGRSRYPVAASLGAFARHGAAIARHARGDWGVSQCLCPVRRSRSASGLLPLPRTQNEPF